MKTTLLLVFMASLTVWGAPQPSQEKIDAFISKLSESCKTEDIQAIKELSCFEGVGAGLVDDSIGFWEMLLDYSKKNGRVFSEAKYVPLEVRLADPNTNQEAIKWAIEPKVRNGHPYALNLPAVGFVTVTFSKQGNGTSSNLWAVGMDANGDLKFPEWKRTDAASASVAARVVSPQSADSVRSPDQEQIAAFTEALFAALQANDLEACKALICFDGVPEELVDKEVDQWKVATLDYAKKSEAVFEKPVFTPLVDFLVKLGENRKAAETGLGPQVRNGRTYRLNLPVVGMVSFSMKTKRGGSMTSGRPVGIDANGVLKIVQARPDL